MENIWRGKWNDMLLCWEESINRNDGTWFQGTGMEKENSASGGSGGGGGGSEATATPGATSTSEKLQADQANPLLDPAALFGGKSTHTGYFPFFPLSSSSPSYSSSSSSFTFFFHFLFFSFFLLFSFFFTFFSTLFLALVFFYPWLHTLTPFTI